jgi:hypothetical protein
MPESTRAVDQGPVEALRRELETARALLQIQQELEHALCTGSSGEQLMILVRREQDAVRAAHHAAAARRAHWDGAEAFEAFLGNRPPEEARSLRGLAREGVEVRETLQRVARRCEYIARRSVEWTQAQMDLVVQMLTRNEAVYQQPGRERPLRETPSLMDRTA